MGISRFMQYVLVVFAAAAFLACGDDDGSSTATGPSGTGATSGATITIGSNATVSPATVTVNAGQTVTFVNNDTRSHQIASDPHPAHTACPPINQLGTLGAGQTRQTGTFTVAGNCGFHDHDDPDNAALRGTITVR